MNFNLVYLPHLRFLAAHWEDPLTAPEAAQACPAGLPSPLNQLIRNGELRTGRPIERAVRFAPVPSQLGGLTFTRPAVLLLPIPACAALMTASGSAGQRLRSLAPPCFAGVCHQRNLPDSLSFARPLLSSSPSAPLQFRAKAIGSFTFPRPAFSFSPDPDTANDPLICGVREVWPGLRPLAQAASAEPANQLTCFDILKKGRSFLPSSLSPKPRLRAERNGGQTSLNPSTGVPEYEFRDSSNYQTGLTGHGYLRGHFPRSNDRQDSTFPRESSGRAAAAISPSVFRVSGTLQKPPAFGSVFSNSRIRAKQPTT